MYLEQRVSVELMIEKPLVWECVGETTDAATSGSHDMSVRSTSLHDQFAWQGHYLLSCLFSTPLWTKQRVVSGKQHDTSAGAVFVHIVIYMSQTITFVACLRANKFTESTAFRWMNVEAS